MAVTVLLSLFVLLLLIGTPIYVCLGLSSLAYLLLSGNLPHSLLINTMAQGIDSFTLLAIPFFIFAGDLMSACGMTTRIFTFLRSVIGSMPGALGHVNVLGSIVFAGMSGSAIADAGGLGKVEIQAMTEQGYPKKYSIGLTAASCLIGPIIPPSIPMVVYAVLASTSISKLFAAGVVPGLLMGVTLSLMNHFYAIRDKLPKDQRLVWSNVIKTGKEAFWSLLAPIFLVGGMLLGIVTPTEAAVLIIGYTLIIGVFVYKNLNFKKILKISMTSIGNTVNVALILAASAIFSWILTYEKLPQAMSLALLSVTHNPTWVVLIIMLILLIIGCVMEAGAAMVVLMPVFLPIANVLHIDLVYLGLIVVLTLMVGLLTPPFGLILFVLSKTTKETVETVIAGTMPFLIPLLIALLLVALFPQISLWLPNLLFR
jgi:tripartite ATP-independent transporter DctM subunit